MTPPRRFNPWPAAIVATFVLFIGGTIVLIVLASKDRNDLVAPDYYEQEIRYQARIDQLRRTEPFAQEITAAYDPRNQQLTVSLPSAHTAAGASGQIRLYRPNHSSADRSFPLHATANGVPSLTAEDLTPGLWKVQLHWKVNADEFYADRSLIVPARNAP